jgi:hypothetical protein
LLIAVASVLGVGHSIVQAQTQTYYYTGPISAQADVDLTPGPGYVGGFVVDFSSISETLTYNPVADTLEEKGSVTLSSPSSGSFNIVNTLGFDGGPAGSASVTVGNNGSFSFDYTATAQNPGGSLGGELLVPVSGSGTYNGQAFSGNWNIQLPLNTDIIAANARSLDFTQFGDNGPGQLSEVPSQEVVQVPGLQGGLQDGSDDDNYFYSWSQDPCAPSAVPEAGSMFVDAMILFPFCAQALRLLRKRQTL